MAFKGWPVEAVEFFEGLEADNSKAYWTEHKPVYEQQVRLPMEQLCADLAPALGEPRMYRPYRDVRFSKDKAPYKTSIAASFAGGGYVNLTAHGLGAGAGYYMMMPDQIERYRAAVDNPESGPTLEAVVKKLERAGISVSSHNPLKTAPKGYAKDHPRIELLRYRDLVSWSEWPVGEWLGTPEPKKLLLGFFKTCRPMLDWLDAHVGRTTMDTSNRR